MDRVFARALRIFLEAYCMSLTLTLVTGNTWILAKAHHGRAHQPQDQHVCLSLGTSTCFDHCHRTNTTNAGTPKNIKNADALAVVAAEAPATPDAPLDPSGLPLTTLYTAPLGLLPQQ